MGQYPEFDFDQVDYVTSDTHFGHARISELASRPFVSVDEMDSTLIHRWNEVVGSDDIVLHLGDLALGPIEQSLPLTSRLNGRRFLVPGNHDRVSPATQTNRAIERFRPLYEAAGWTILPEVVEGTRRGYRLLASHYPYAGDSHDVDRHAKHRPRWDDGVPLLHGHTHARDRGPDGHQFHVGVDAHGFSPIAFTIIDTWLRSLPDAETYLDAAVREARQVIADLDDAERPGMDELFYAQGYNELRVVLGDLLDAVSASARGRAAENRP